MILGRGKRLMRKNGIQAQRRGGGPKDFSALKGGNQNPLKIGR